MNNHEYPRDLVGYGRRPPQADWPGGARIAVQFVLNYEEGAESSVLHGDAGSETFLSEIVNATPYAGARHMSMESLYEYGSRAGGGGGAGVFPGRRPAWRMATRSPRTAGAGSTATACPRPRSGRTSRAPSRASAGSRAGGRS